MKASVNDEAKVDRENWTVAPNPTTNGVIHVQVQLNSNKSLAFRLTDVGGKLIMQQKFEGVKGDNHFTLRQERNLPAGVYYLKAVGLEGEDVKKIMVR